MWQTEASFSIMLYLDDSLCIPDGAQPMSNCSNLLCGSGTAEIMLRFVQSMQKDL